MYHIKLIKGLIMATICRNKDICLGTIFYLAAQGFDPAKFS